MPWVACFPRYHDPWLDNGLETLYDMVVQSGQASPITAWWEGGELRLAYADLESAVHWLEGLIAQRAATYLVFDRQAKDQTIRTYQHHHVIFRTQPSNQQPVLLRSDPEKGKEERLAFLEEALRSATEGAEPLADGRRTTTRRRRRPPQCPFCGREGQAPLEDMTQSLYPLATKTAALSGPRSVPGGARQLLSQTYQKACAPCRLVAALGWIDGAWLFHTFLRGREVEWSLLMAPDPAGRAWSQIHEAKRQIRRATVRRQERTNLILASPGAEPGEQRGAKVPPGTIYGLLLAYSQEALLHRAEPGEDLWSPRVRVVPEQWVELSIPGGRMKNLKLTRRRLDEPSLGRLAAWLEEGERPAHWLLELNLARTDGARVDPEKRERAVRACQEALAQGMIEDRYTLFARSFLPRRGFVVQPRSTWSQYLGTLVNLLRTWRREHGVTPEQLDLIRRSGQSLGRIAAGHISLIYKLERARRYQDLLDVMAQVGHFLAGAEEEKLKSISVNALDELTRLVASEGLPVDEIRNTLVIFASLEVAHQKLRKAARSEDATPEKEAVTSAS